MNSIKFNLTIFQSLAIALLIHSVHFPQRLLAEETQIISQSNNDEITIRFIPANSSHENNTPPPEEASDGPGSRGHCIAKLPPMTRLAGREPLHLTVSSHPTFWVYVPYTAEEAPSGVFSLEDRSSLDGIWKTEFQLPNRPGIVSISLPPDVPALEVGRTYRWYFELNCPKASSSNQNITPAYVIGIVKRVSNLNIENQINTTLNPLEQVKIYAENGIWYNAIAELANLRLGDRENSMLEQAWVDLLSQEEIGLEEISQEDIVENVITNFPPE